MTEWDEKPHSAASKLEFGTKDQRQVSLCPSSVEEEKPDIMEPGAGRFHSG